ncbi:MAG TPA: hypothetical protein VNB06_18705 [Thermoanaerobaculia bacterium]|nr:hypothetical protein [Thermoanaerobaculia bacterium]
MTQGPPTFQRVEELFHRAAELPAEKRAAFLAAECADAPAVRAEFEALLDHERRGASPLLQALGAPLDVARHEAAPLEIGGGPFSHATRSGYQVGAQARWLVAADELRPAPRRPPSWTTAGMPNRGQGEER